LFIPLKLFSQAIDLLLLFSPRTLGRCVDVLDGGADGAEGLVLLVKEGTRFDEELLLFVVVLGEGAGLEAGKAFGELLVEFL
jgi:hypothetical protein